VGLTEDVCRGGGGAGGGGVGVLVWGVGLVGVMAEGGGEGE